MTSITIGVALISLVSVRYKNILEKIQFVEIILLALALVGITVKDLPSWIFPPVIVGLLFFVLVIASIKYALGWYRSIPFALVKVRWRILLLLGLSLICASVAGSVFTYPNYPSLASSLSADLLLAGGSFLFGSVQAVLWIERKRTKRAEAEDELDPRTLRL